MTISTINDNPDKLENTFRYAFISLEGVCQPVADKEAPGQQPACLPSRPKSEAGEKSVDSCRILFYDQVVNCVQGGDPGVSVALFYTPEILKQRRPESLGKALDSEAV
jgi:hypothetical protein